MKVKLHYFGMIAEKLEKKSEEISLDFTGDTLNLRKFITDRYPVLQTMNFQIAVNQKIMESIVSGMKISEIALLPPFAGG